MDKIKRASILCKRLVPVITIAIFAIILFLRNSVSADTFTFTFNGWTETFQNSGSTITTKWDPTSESYCYMTYGKTASASIKYRTKWVTITPGTVDKWTFPYENSSYWTEANHEQDVPAYNGYTYTLLSIKKETLNNILKARGCESLEEMAAKNSDSTATVYLQSSHIFLNGETPIDTNGTQGFYNYGMSWNKANALGFASGNYFTGYNVPINLKVPKKVNLYLQSYTSEAGGSTYTKIENNNRFSEVSRQSSAGRNVTFTVSADVTANSIAADENGNDKVSIPQSYTKGTTKYYLWKVLVQATSSKKYPKTVKGDRGWNNKMGAVTYDNISNYAATNGSTVYHDALQTLRNTTVPTNNGSKQGNIVVRAIYTSVKRNLTVKYYEAKKSNGKYTLPTKASETDENALAFSLGDKITIRVGATASTSTNRYVASTKYNEKFIYKAVLVDGKGTQVLTWPTTNEQDELYRASGYTKQYKEDVKTLKSLYYKETSNGNYTLKLYYVPTDKAVVSINYRYLDWDGNVIATPEGLPDSLATTTARLGDTWKFSSAKKATYSQGDYYYYSYDATYYAKNGLGTTRTTIPTKYASKMPLRSTISTISNDFAALKRNESYPVYGNITITVTYRALPPDEQKGVTYNYKVIAHLQSSDGSTEDKVLKDIHKDKGSQINTQINGTEASATTGKKYTFVNGKASGSLSRDLTSDRSQLDKQSFNLNSDTVIDLYYKEIDYYTVTVHWRKWKDKDSDVWEDLKDPEVVDTIKKNDKFTLGKYETYFYDKMDKQNKKWIKHSATIHMDSSSGELTGKYDKNEMASFNRITVMYGDVDLYFYYVTDRVPVEVHYVDEITGETLDSQVLLYSKPYGWKNTLSKYEMFDEKIGSCAMYERNGKHYAYTGNASIENFASGNFSKTAKSLADLGKWTVGIPEDHSKGTPTINLYYRPGVNLTIKYKSTKDSSFDLYPKKTFESAMTKGKAYSLGSDPEITKFYFEQIPETKYKFVSGTGNTKGVHVSYDGKTDKLASITDLMNKSIAPTTDVVITLWYGTPPTDPKVPLKVQWMATDGTKINDPVLVNRYNLGDEASLSKLQSAVGSNKNWLLNSPDIPGYTAYTFANSVKIITNGKTTSYGWSLGQIPTQKVTMNAAVTVQLYYTPKYTLTINYLNGYGSIKVKESVTINIGAYGQSFSMANYSNYLYETINNTYFYKGRYNWNNNGATDGTLSQVAQNCNVGSLTGNLTLNLHYSSLPGTTATIYVVDQSTNKVLASSETLYQHPQKSTVGLLFANDSLAKQVLNSVTPDLSAYGYNGYSYSGQYIAKARNATDSYDPLTVPPDAKQNGGLEIVKGVSVYSETQNYDIYMFYKKKADVQVVYVNAETGEILDNKPIDATVGEPLSIDKSYVKKLFTMKNFSGAMTDGYFVGYKTCDDGSYDAGSPPSDFIYDMNVEHAQTPAVLTRNPLKGDYYVYLYYQVPYKLTIHYFYNGEERTDMGKILDMTPVKNYRVPQEYVYSSLGNGSLVAWDMAGAKDVDRKLISSVQDFLNDGDAVIPNANQDTDLNLYYRYLEAPTPEPVDQSMDTTKDSDIMDDAGNLDFNSSGEIYDDASDDAVDGYSKAKTYDVARADSGIANGDIFSDFGCEITLHKNVLFFTGNFSLLS